MELRIVSTGLPPPLPSNTPPAPPPLAVLFVIVEFVIVSGTLPIKMPPALFVLTTFLILPEMVEPVTNVGPKLSMPPPPLLALEILPETVEPTTFNVPALAMPPPKLAAVLPVIQQSLTINILDGKLFEMPPPTPLTFPPVSVMPLRLAEKPELILKTRADPLNASVFRRVKRLAPGPTTVVFELMGICPLASRMVRGTLKKVGSKTMTPPPVVLASWAA